MMSKVALITGILFIVLGVIIFMFTEGLRSYYSGIFFALLGTVILMGALRRKSDANK
jgi:FtsH-binding integral membrane protein